MTGTDSLLLWGNGDERLGKLLRRMGYRVTSADPAVSLPDMLSREPYDLLIVNVDSDLPTEALLEFIRRDEYTRSVPVICLGCSAEDSDSLNRSFDDRVDVIPAPASLGLIASKIATQLRMRKMAGVDEGRASLGEILAAQRDLNKRFAKEVKEARAIQESLLPKKLPLDSRYEIAAKYTPLDDVGGDWYAVEVERSGKLTLQVADVTGHGVSAALIGSMTKLALHASTNESPGPRIQSMNKLMTPCLPEGCFVSLIGYLYDPESGAISFARAGHPPALVFRARDRSVEQFAPPGFPFGLMEDAEFGESETVLNSGDCVVLFTDGLTEARTRSGQMFGMDRFGEAVRRAATGADAKTMLANVLSHFEKFVDGRVLRDDVTVVVLKRK